MIFNYLKKISKLVKKETYDGQYCVRDSYTKIIDFFKINNIYTDKNIVIVCIGTNRSNMIDCVGPFIGSILKEDKEFDIPIFGTMVNPIHALNIERSISEIKSKYPNAIIIAIDGALSDEQKIGKFDIRNGTVRPGKGVGRDLIEVGDIYIKAYVAPIGIDLIEYGIDLNFISEMAYTIAKGVKEALKKEGEIV